MKTIILVIVVLAVVGGGYYFFSKDSAEMPLGDTGGASGTMLEGSGEPDGGLVGGDAAIGEAADQDGGVVVDDGAREFVVEGKNFAFSPNALRVKKGDTVRVIFRNTGGMHDFVIDEFDVATKQIQGGATDTVEFVADKAGSFEFYCSVGSHRQMGMVGTLTVE